VHYLEQHDRAGSECRERYDGDDAECCPQYRAAEDDNHDSQCDRCVQGLTIAL